MTVEMFIFTLCRYRAIKKLSDYLIKVQNSGQAAYDTMALDSYREGELSILKTEIYKVTRILIEQKEKLKNEKLFLADSLADISHQLKTPLTSMTVMADLLDDENISGEKRTEFVRNIHIQLNRIDWLVSTLLKMSKLDAGTIKMSPSYVNMRELAELSFNHLMIPMELKNQTFEISGDVNAGCICDRNWMSEAIANIGKNCMEHTPVGGSINVAVEDNSIYSKIIISDNGSGIDKEDLPHIFERFYKGKNSSKDSVGIGLAFAKQIVTAHDGTIEVSDRSGGGAQFEIRLYKKIV